MSSTVLHPSGTVSYHEPSLPSLLTLISFIYFLNIARNVADYLLGAGLLGQVAIGVIYGPVAKILPTESEQTFLALGYLGLILIVFEGGLTLELNSFLPLLPLSFLSALIGILLPLSFTFALFSSSLYSYPTLQAFTAGSALASTSLGTTFFVLKSVGGNGNGLEKTRISQVLKGAALVDDIVALVLLSVIKSLAIGEEEGGGKSLGWTIGRPIVASIGMCLFSPLIIWYILRPLFKTRKVKVWVEKGGKSLKLFLGVSILSTYLTIAYYIGTTVLLGAFLAGVTLPFLSPSTTPPTCGASNSPTFEELYQFYLEPLQNYLLVPFFFGSIGYSIPFLQVFEKEIVWKGIVYSILMILGKVLVGVCVIVNDIVTTFFKKKNVSYKEEDKKIIKRQGNEFFTPKNTSAELTTSISSSMTLSTHSKSARGSFVSETLPASLFLGVALVARGEIGILVLQVAYNSNDSTSNSSSSTTTSVLSTEPYLISIWSVAVCTIVGPVAFSQLVKSKWGREGVLKGTRWN
ncbi:hypothetical protein JCM3765_002129 [Sporobolomyces pararoseus]